MEESKLAHSWVGAVIAWLITLVAWLGAHMGIVCGILAAIASFYSIRASQATKRYWDKKTAQLGSKTKADPETET